MKINERYKGIIYIILAAIGFAFMNLFVKTAGDLPTFQKAFFRKCSKRVQKSMFSYAILLKAFHTYYIRIV